MKNQHIIKSFRQRLDVAVDSWLIMYDVRFVKTFRDYGLPDISELPAAKQPAILDQAKTQSEANKQVTDILLGYRRRVEIKTPLESVIISRESVRHIVSDRESFRERHVNFIRPTLEEPVEIWLWYDAKRKVYRRKFIKVFEAADKKRNFFAVVQEKSDGNILITAFRANTKYINNQRARVLLYGG